MKKLFEGENSLQEKVLSLPNFKRFLVEIDDDGNLKGYFPIKKKNLGKGWIALYQEPIEWLASLRLTGEQYRVMLLLFARLDFDNYLRVSLQDIASALKMQPAHVSRALRTLKALNIVLEGPAAGKFKTYRLNPHIAYKGFDRSDNILSFEDEIAKNQN